MRRCVRLALCAGLALVAAGCGDDGVDPVDTGGQLEGCDVLEGFDDYVAGIQKDGENGYSFTLVSSTPAPPRQGENTWIVDIVGPNAAPLDAATALKIRPWMPDHGHGTNIVATAEPVAEAPGRFEIGPVDLWMPGVWTVDVTVQNEARAPVDTGVFAFCIEG